MSTIRRKKFQDREYRASYAESFLDAFIASQIRVIREQRGLTQKQLAEAAGMLQSRISALENASYSKWSIGTLKRLARAFDVPLRVSFGTFSELVRDADAYGRKSLERPAFADDLLMGETVGTTTAYVETASLPLGMAHLSGQVIGGMKQSGGTWTIYLDKTSPADTTPALANVSVLTQDQKSEIEAPLQVALGRAA